MSRNTPLRLFVIGTGGQVSTALDERATHHDVEITAVGFPALDLSAPPEAIERVVFEAARASNAQAIVNTAAYTAVDKAEDEPEIAMAINGTAPGAIARAAAALKIPVVHISTDYVFDGAKDGLWLEDDPKAPLGVYGRTKLAGELAVAEAAPDHATLRTAWVYAPFGANFAKTMLRLASEGKTEVSVVADQHGCPTSALDIADAICVVTRNLVDQPDNANLRGVFHLVGEGATNWAEFARAIFDGARERSAPFATVRDITTSDYPTKAKRPANSRLDTSRIKRFHGIETPPWRNSLDVVLNRLTGK